MVKNNVMVSLALCVILTLTGCASGVVSPLYAATGVGQRGQRLMHARLLYQQVIGIEGGYGAYGYLRAGQRAGEAGQYAYQREVELTGHAQRAVAVVALPGPERSGGGGGADERYLVISARECEKTVDCARVGQGIELQYRIFSR